MKDQVDNGIAFATPTEPIMNNTPWCTPSMVGVVSRNAWRCDVWQHEWLSSDGFLPLSRAKPKPPYWDQVLETGA